MATTWHKFPFEIKFEIVKHRLRVQNPITGLTHPSHLCRLFLPLALSNKECYDLVREAYYSENTFVVSGAKGTNSDAAWMYPKSPVSNWIRHLTVKIWTDQPYGRNSNDYHAELERHLKGRGDFRFLLRPDEADANWIMATQAPGWYNRCGYDATTWRSGATLWQQLFRKLKSLRIEILFSESRELPKWKLSCGETPRSSDSYSVAHRNDFICMLKNASIDMRAKKVEVVVKGLDCGRTCDGKCAEVCAAAIKSMVKAPDADEDGNNEREAGDTLDDSLANKHEDDGVMQITAAES